MSDRPASVAEAFAVAAERWPTDSVPPNPVGWIVTTARRRALDRIRRESVRTGSGTIVDDRLRLLFTCCHPALAVPARVAPTLRLLGAADRPDRPCVPGPEPTMAQRIVRATTKIRQARIPYRVPGPDELPARLSGVLAALSLPGSTVEDERLRRRRAEVAGG